MARTYGQFCAVARALDHVGDRWTLLIIRELVLGPAGYGDLAAALDGIPSNLLASRLRSMGADGILERETDGQDRRRVTYRLTSLGESLGPVLDALIVWGARWMSSGPGDDRFDARWSGLALRALLEDRRSAFAGVVELRFETGSVQIAGTAHNGSPAATATVQGPAQILLALASGDMGLDEAAQVGVVIDGDRRLLRHLLG